MELFCLSCKRNGQGGWLSEWEEAHKTQPDPPATNMYDVDGSRHIVMWHTHGAGVWQCSEIAFAQRKEAEAYLGRLYLQETKPDAATITEVKIESI
jgi:hypothetical protein